MRVSLGEMENIMKFCGKCGAKVSDGVVFCPNCGESIGENGDEAVTQNEFFEADTKTQRQGKIIANALRIIILAAVLIVAFLSVKSLFFKKPYEKIIEKYYDALENQDVDKLYSLFPPQYYESMEKELDYDEEDIRDGFRDKLQSELESAENEYGDDITYKVEEYTDIDKYDNDKLDIMNDSYSEIGMEASQMYEVGVKVKTNGKEGTGVSDENFFIIKVDGKWYMMG